MVLWVGLQSVIVAFPGQTHLLLFLVNMTLHIATNQRFTAMGN